MKQFYKTKQEIDEWLRKHDVNNYSLSPDSTYGFTAGCSMGVNLSHQNLSFIPVKFSQVAGSFDCSLNKLTSLEFSPNYVAGDFKCSANKLKSLKGAPARCYSFNCSGNLLISLEHSPKKLSGSFICSYNKLITLEHCTTDVGLDFSCTDNELKHLDFLPEKIVGLFFCANNPQLLVLQDMINLDLIKEEYAKMKSIQSLANKLDKGLIQKKSRKSVKI